MIKQNRSPFLAYRYLVTPINNLQTSLLHGLNKKKEELIVDIFESINNNTKTEWVIGKKRYLFYGFQKSEHVFIIKFARESNENLYLEGDKDIEIKDIKETKFVYLIVDTKHQIILIERNMSIFVSITNSIEVISLYLRRIMKEYDYVVNIYPLVSKTKFWSYVESADEIFELSLELNAPNLPLFGNADTRKVLQIIKDTTNNEVFDIAFKNKEGKLKIIKDVLGSWIDYIREVGGRYVLKFKNEKYDHVQVKTSDTDTAQVYIERKKNDKYSDEELKVIKEKLDSLNTLETRDDAEE